MEAPKTMADRSQLAEELKRWCRGEGLEEVKTLMIMAPEEVETAEIEETIQTVKCLGRVRVRGRMFHPTQNCVMVLCECKEDCNENVPPEVFHAGSETSWPIITLSEAPAPRDFSFKLKALMDAEGKTMNDIKGLLPESVPQISAHKPQPEGGYRRLRLFFGNMPVPPNEEPFDQWLEQAWLMVEESEGTEKEKRRRLMESLKGPALEIAKSIREADPEANPTLETRWSPIPYKVTDKLPNLPVYQLKKESGSGKVKTVHRDHILHIGQNVRLPVTSEDKNCAKTKPKSSKASTAVFEPPGSQDTESFSEDEYYQPPRPYYCSRERIQEGMRHALQSQERRRDNLIYEQDNGEEERHPNGDSAGEEPQDESVRQHDVESDSEISSGESNQEESDPDGEEEQDLITEPKVDDRTARSARVPKLNTPHDRLANTPDHKSKRTIKPVVRLTYDEPGKARDQPITIIHRGVVITIGQD
uniref:Uncharacterized protein n=1 Tax=Oryzias latipes TaxID=8090 RepID=A0A3P9IZE6_ORYLA